MKRLVLLSVMLSLSGFASQAIAANTNAPASNIAPEVKSPTAAPSWLGVWIDDIPASLGSHLSPILKKNQGLIIQKTFPDSPAAKAGLRTFDIIAKFNDQDIFSKRQLTQLIQSSQPGTTAELSLVRQGQLMTQSVTLAELPKKQPPMMRHKHHHRMPSMPPNFGTGSRHFMPPPWMNEPFFNPDFDRYLQKRFQQPNLSMPQKNNWAQFESIQIESTGKDKHRAEVKFEDGEGNKKHFVFEGNFNEIRQQIMAQEDMDEDKKQNLLQALEMNTSPPLPPFGQHGFMAPDWFQQPLSGPNWLPNKP